MGRFADAADEVSKRLQDIESANRDRVKAWLNLSKDQFLVESRTWDWLQETNTLITTADVSEYDLSLLVAGGETWSVTRVEYLWEPVTNERLEEISQRLFDEFYGLSTDKRKPEAWTTWGGKILLGPIPNSVVTYKVRFFRDIPDFLEGVNETPPWPKFWDEIWYAYAEYIGLRFNDDARARERLADFNAGVMDMRGGDTPRSKTALYFGDRRSRTSRVPYRYRNDITLSGT